MFLSHPPEGWPRQGGVSFPGLASLTVRLAPMQVPLPEDPDSSAPQAGRVPAPAKSLTVHAESVPTKDPVSATVRSAAESLTLPPAPDSRYYPARDLDTYPRPLAPLQLDVLREGRTGEVRFEMLIDEAGVVQGVIFIEPSQPGAVEEGLRAVLAAARFQPALKDGRAVRSRLVLSVSLESASER
jgi:protein TonB